MLCKAKPDAERQMKRNLIYHTQIPIHNSVSTRTESGEFQTQFERIARDGMTLSCDRKTLDQLFPNTASIAPRQPKSMQVTFTLPGQQQNIKAACEVFSLRRLSRDCFELEMHFQQLSEQHERLIDDYIEANLKQIQQGIHQAA